MQNSPSFKCVAFLIVGIVLGITAYAGYQSMTLLKSDSAPGQQQNTQLHPVLNPTADWKTYADPTHTFTMKHPSSFFEFPAQQYINSSLVAAGWESAGEISTVSPLDKLLGPKDMQIHFTIEPKKSDDTLANFFAKENNGPWGSKVDSSKSIVVAGKDGLWLEGIPGPTVFYVEILIPQSDTSVVVLDVYDGEDEATGGHGTDHAELMASVSQMLSTFRFTK